MTTTNSSSSSWRRPLKILATLFCLGAASQMTTGCVAAAAYAAYKWSQSEQHSEDQKTARACLDTKSQDTEFCSRILREMVRE